MPHARVTATCVEVRTHLLHEQLELLHVAYRYAVIVSILSSVLFSSIFSSKVQKGFKFQKMRQSASVFPQYDISHKVEFLDLKKPIDEKITLLCCDRSVSRFFLFRL